MNPLTLLPLVIFDCPHAAGFEDELVNEDGAHIFGAGKEYERSVSTSTTSTRSLASTWRDQAGNHGFGKAYRNIETIHSIRSVFVTESHLQ